MSDVEANAELKARIENLEQFKHDLEKKLYAATVVAAVFGVTSFVGGAYITSLTHTLNSLSEKSGQIEKVLSQRDGELAKSLKQMETALSNALSAIDSKANATGARLTQESEQLASQHRAKLTKALEQIQRETNQNLIVRGIKVKNAQGNTVAALSSDDTGDGFFQIYTDKGELRYSLYIVNKRAQSDFYGQNGKNLISVGIFNNADKGYVRINDTTGQRALLDLTTDPNGGRLKSYSQNGNTIV